MEVLEEIKMKEALVQVQRMVVRNGKPIVACYWVRPDQVKEGDIVLTPPTTDYHINQIDYDEE